MDVKSASSSGTLEDNRSITVYENTPVFPAKAPSSSNSTSTVENANAKKAAHTAKMHAGLQKYREWKRTHKVDPKKLKEIRLQRTLSETTLRGLRSFSIEKILRSEGINKPTKHAVEGVKAASLNFLESVLDNVISTRVALQKKSKTISAREIYDELKTDPILDGIWIDNPEFGKPLKKRKKEVQEDVESTENEEDDEEDKKEQQPKKKKQKKSPSTKKVTTSRTKKSKTPSKAKAKAKTPAKANKSKTPAKANKSKTPTKERKSKTPSKKKTGK